MAQVLEHLLSKEQALSSNPGTAKKKKKGKVEKFWRSLYSFFQ
jgi:hypothetical protein